MLAAVLWRFDLHSVRAALARVGIEGFAAIVLAGLAAEIVLAVGICPLLPRRVPLSVVVAARQLRDSSADVLPITQLGGIAFAARALSLGGLKLSESFAATVADLTTETFAQGLYVLTGVLASLSLLSRSAAVSPYVGAMLGGALVLSAGSIGFAVLQISGSRLVGRASDRMFPAALSHAEAFHAAIAGIYRRRRAIVFSILLQFAGWIASGLWLWAVLWTMDLKAHFWAAIAIQALVEGLRSAAVFVPAGIGVQEAGYVLLAPVFGLSPEIGLAVSLLRRARDVVVAVPVLLLWQAIEARNLARA